MEMTTQSRVANGRLAGSNGGITSGIRSDRTAIKALNLFFRSENVRRASRSGARIQRN